MCKISLEYKLKTKFSLKQVALQVELGEFRGNFGGVRKMFLKYLSVRCVTKDTKLAQVRLASIAIAGVPHVTVVGYAGGLAIKNAPAPWHSAHSCY